MGEVWLDAQAAQNRVHFDRGIARYVCEQVRAVSELAPERVQAVALNASHPLMSNLDFVLGSQLATFREVRDRPPEPRPAIYHVMSPFELDRSLDELWPAWARVPSVTTVVTLYDLIPLVFEQHYLRDPIIRARFEARANLVRSAHHVLAISQRTAADATELLGIAPQRISVIDAGVSRAFGDQPPAALPARFPELREGFMLYVSGIEFRKNNERLIAAYGRMEPALRARHQLVITCKALPEERAELERLAAAAGLREGELIVTGYVSDAELAALYRSARLFVFASFYEGSGLPVLEAMASGLPVAASNTSTSPEILGDLGATFDPFDPDDIARVLSATVADDGMLERLRTRSRERVRHYTWQRVGERTLAGYDAALRARQGAIVRERPRLALLTPWPPERSGIADYNQRLVPALAQHADVDVIVDGYDAERPQPDAPGARLLSTDALEGWARFLRVYDRVLYCMGNSSYHGWIYEAMKVHPGVLVAHDARLTGFYGWYSGVERPEDPTSRLMERIRAMYGDRVDWMQWRDRPPTPEEQQALGLYMTHEVQEYAHFVLAHSRYAADILALDRPPDRRVDPPIRVVAHAMPTLRPGFRQPWHDAPLIVSFGVVSYIKGLETLLQAFAQLAPRHPTARLILAGHGPKTEVDHWRKRAEELDLAERVEVPGYVSRHRYDELLAQASVSVQLRLTSNGEASGAVANNLAAGLPTIVTDIGWFSELPREAVVHVQPGVGPGTLAAQIERLLDDDEHAEAVAAAGRRYAERTSFASVARSYVATLVPSADPPPVPLEPAPATVVIITNDRVDRLLLALRALERQTSQRFAVVIADDGSTDGTSDEVERLARSPRWRGRLRWVGVEGGPHGSGIPRNVGAGHAAPDTSVLVFVDADVLVVPRALERVLEIHTTHPDAAIFGMVHWLEPMDLVTVARELERDVLGAHVPEATPHRYDGTIVGPDGRGAEHFAPAAVAAPRPVAPELALSTFAAIPRRVFEQVGGFDNDLRGYGYEDMEFGIRLRDDAVEALFVSDVVGYHVWHPKHDWQQLALENERNLDYVLRKHGLDSTSDRWADWSVWWHYHSDRGGRVVRADGRLWAIDRGDRVRLALPGEEWVQRLGFAPEQVEDAAEHDLGRLRDVGQARELELERFA